MKPILCGLDLAGSDWFGGMETHNQAQVGSIHCLKFNMCHLDGQKCVDPDGPVVGNPASTLITRFICLFVLPH